MATKTTEVQLLEEINEKLAQLVGLAAIQGKGLEAQLDLLQGLGFTHEKAGRLVGMKPAAVQKRLERRAGKVARKK